MLVGLRQQDLERSGGLDALSAAWRPYALAHFAVKHRFAEAREVPEEGAWHGGVFGSSPEVLQAQRFNRMRQRLSDDLTKRALVTSADWREAMQDAALSGSLEGVTDDLLVDLSGGEEKEDKPELDAELRGYFYVKPQHGEDAPDEQPWHLSHLMVLAERYFLASPKPKAMGDGFRNRLIHSIFNAVITDAGWHEADDHGFVKAVAIESVLLSCDKESREGDKLIFDLLQKLAKPEERESALEGFYEWLAHKTFGAVGRQKLLNDTGKELYEAIVAEGGQGYLSDVPQTDIHSYGYVMAVTNYLQSQFPDAAEGESEAVSQFFDNLIIEYRGAAHDTVLAARFQAVLRGFRDVLARREAGSISMPELRAILARGEANWFEAQMHEHVQVRSAWQAIASREPPRGRLGRETAARRKWREAKEVLDSNRFPLTVFSAPDGFELEELHGIDDQVADAVFKRAEAYLLAPTHKKPKWPGSAGHRDSLILSCFDILIAKFGVHEDYLAALRDRLIADFPLQHALVERYIYALMVNLYRADAGVSLEKLQDIEARITGLLGPLDLMVVADPKPISEEEAEEAKTAIQAHLSSAAASSQEAQKGGGARALNALSVVPGLSALISRSGGIGFSDAAMPVDMVDETSMSMPIQLIFNSDSEEKDDRAMMSVVGELATPTWRAAYQSVCGILLEKADDGRPEGHRLAQWFRDSIPGGYEKAMREKGLSELVSIMFDGPGGAHESLIFKPQFAAAYPELSRFAKVLHEAVTGGMFADEDAEAVRKSIAAGQAGFDEVLTHLISSFGHEHASTELEAADLDEFIATLKQQFEWYIEASHFSTVENAVLDIGLSNAQRKVNKMLLSPWSTWSMSMVYNTMTWMRSAVPNLVNHDQAMAAFTKETFEGMYESGGSQPFQELVRGAIELTSETVANDFSPQYPSLAFNVRFWEFSKTMAPKLSLVTREVLEGHTESGLTAAASEPFFASYLLAVDPGQSHEEQSEAFADRLDQLASLRDSMFTAVAKLSSDEQKVFHARERKLVALAYQALSSGAEKDLRSSLKGLEHYSDDGFHNAVCNATVDIAKQPMSMSVAPLTAVMQGHFGFTERKHQYLMQRMVEKALEDNGSLSSLIGELASWAHVACVERGLSVEPLNTYIKQLIPVMMSISNIPKFDVNEEQLTVALAERGINPPAGYEELAEVLQKRAVLSAAKKIPEMWGRYTNNLDANDYDAAFFSERAMDMLEKLAHEMCVQVMDPPFSVDRICAQIVASGQSEFAKLVSDSRFVANVSAHTQGYIRESVAPHLDSLSAAMRLDESAFASMATAQANQRRRALAVLQVQVNLLRDQFAGEALDSDAVARAFAALDLSLAVPAAMSADFAVIQQAIQEFVSTDPVAKPNGRSLAMWVQDILAAISEGNGARLHDIATQFSTHQLDMFAGRVGARAEAVADERSVEEVEAALRGKISEIISALEGVDLNEVDARNVDRARVMLAELNLEKLDELQQLVQGWLRGTHRADILTELGHDPAAGVVLIGDNPEDQLMEAFRHVEQVHHRELVQAYPLDNAQIFAKAYFNRVVAKLIAARDADFYQQQWSWPGGKVPSGIQGCVTDIPSALAAIVAEAVPEGGEAKAAAQHKIDTFTNFLAAFDNGFAKLAAYVAGEAVPDRAYELLNELMLKQHAVISAVDEDGVEILEKLGSMQAWLEAGNFTIDAMIARWGELAGEEPLPLRAYSKGQAKERALVEQMQAWVADADVAEFRAALWQASSITDLAGQAIALAVSVEDASIKRERLLAINLAVLTNDPEEQLKIRQIMAAARVVSFEKALAAYRAIVSHYANEAAALSLHDILGTIVADNAEAKRASAVCAARSTVVFSDEAAQYFARRERVAVDLDVELVESNARLPESHFEDDTSSYEGAGEEKEDAELVEFDEAAPIPATPPRAVESELEPEPGEAELAINRALLPFAALDASWRRSGGAVITPAGRYYLFDQVRAGHSPTGETVCALDYAIVHGNHSDTMIDWLRGCRDAVWELHCQPEDGAKAEYLHRMLGQWLIALRMQLGLTPEETSNAARILIEAVYAATGTPTELIQARLAAESFPDIDMVQDILAGEVVGAQGRGVSRDKHQAYLAQLLHPLLADAIAKDAIDCWSDEAQVRFADIWLAAHCINFLEQEPIQEGAASAVGNSTDPVAYAEGLYTELLGKVLESPDTYKLKTALLQEIVKPTEYDEWCLRWQATAIKSAVTQEGDAYKDAEGIYAEASDALRRFLDKARELHAAGRLPKDVHWALPAMRQQVFAAMEMDPAEEQAFKQQIETELHGLAERAFANVTINRMFAQIEQQLRARVVRMPAHAIERSRALIAFGRAKAKKPHCDTKDIAREDLALGDVEFTDDLAAFSIPEDEHGDELRQAFDLLARKAHQQNPKASQAVFARRLAEEYGKLKGAETLDAALDAIDWEALKQACVAPYKTEFHENLRQSGDAVDGYDLERAMQVERGRAVADVLYWAENMLVWIGSLDHLSAHDKRVLAQEKVFAPLIAIRREYDDVEEQPISQVLFHPDHDADFARCQHVSDCFRHWLGNVATDSVVDGSALGFLHDTDDVTSYAIQLKVGGPEKDQAVVFETSKTFHHVLEELGYCDDGYFRAGFNGSREAVGRIHSDYKSTGPKFAAVRTVPARYYVRGEHKATARRAVLTTAIGLDKSRVDAGFQVGEGAAVPNAYQYFVNFPSVVKLFNTIVDIAEAGDDFAAKSQQFKDFLDESESSLREIAKYRHNPALQKALKMAYRRLLYLALTDDRFKFLVDLDTQGCLKGHTSYQVSLNEGADDPQRIHVRRSWHRFAEACGIDGTVANWTRGRMDPAQRASHAETLKGFCEGQEVAAGINQAPPADDDLDIEVGAHDQLSVRSPVRHSALEKTALHTGSGMRSRRMSTGDLRGGAATPLFKQFSRRRLSLGSSPAGGPESPVLDE